MEKLEVGEYVRSKKGYIAKIKDIICKGYPVKSLEGYIICDDEDGTIINPNEVIKHSKSLIDLIEVGDIVNEYIVLDVMEDLQTGEIHLEMPSSFPKKGSCAIYKDEIETILTKEQYMQNCYKLEEK